MPRPSVNVDVGQRFGFWEVIAPVVETGESRRAWCRCRCGVERKVGVGSLRGGGTKSCGCQGKRTTPKPPPAAKVDHQPAGLSAEIPLLRAKLAELRDAGEPFEAAWSTALDEAAPSLAGEGPRARERVWLREILAAHRPIWESAYEAGQAQTRRLPAEDALRLKRLAA